MNPIRKLRIESVLLKSITEIINRTFGMIATVANVTVADDSKSAVVSPYLLDASLNARDVEAAIRVRIGKSLTLRNTPKLSFVTTRKSLDAL